MVVAGRLPVSFRLTYPEAETMTDSEILERLRVIDESDVDVTQWEAKFLNTVLGQDVLTFKQRSIALEMIEKYGGRF